MYLWLDLETTGLDPLNDRILQVAYGITNEKMRRWIPVKDNVVTINKDIWDLIKASPFIQDMHGKTGLLERLTGEGTLLIEDIEHAILSDIDKVDAWRDELMYSTERPEPERVTLAGASVHFDMAFIAEWMPLLHARLHHRIFDTSTLQAFFHTVGMSHSVSNSSQHDAVHDVLYCMEVAESYIAQIKELA